MNNWFDSITWSWHWENGVDPFVYGKYTPNAPQKDGKCPSCKFNGKNINVCKRCRKFDVKNRTSLYCFGEEKASSFFKIWRQK
jgi:hypothetical protein